MTDEPRALALMLPPWAVVSPGRVEHILRVVALVDDWARTRALGGGEVGRWIRAAALHDALRDADDAVLARYAPQGEWPRKLWHGPAAAAAAALHGEKDEGVLNAVRYHSVGFTGWDDVGKALYLADYLEPGRDHEREASAALADRVPRELEAVLREVAAQRIGHLVATGKRIGKETWAFWNRLAADA